LKTARHEFEQMVCHYGRMDRLAYYTGAKKLTAAARRRVDRGVKMRAKGIPLGHILGLAPFYGRDFLVTPDTLIPRPETERLVEEALKVLRANYEGKTPSVLDMGTGSGCIAASLTLEGPACRMTAIEASTKALAVARKNFKRLGLDKKIDSYPSALFSRFFGKKAIFDIIVSNPPYIPNRELKTLSREVRREPELALDGGPDGLSIVDAILEQGPKFLKPGGWILLELGKGQSKKLAKKWAGKFRSLKFEKDLNGIERFLIAWTN
jgi:release factor glutamine methyltransferase